MTHSSIRLARRHAGQHAEAFVLPVLVAPLEQQLQPQADTQKGSARVEAALHPLSPV